MNQDFQTQLQMYLSALLPFFISHEQGGLLVCASGCEPEQVLQARFANFQWQNDSKPADLYYARLAGKDHDEIELEGFVDNVFQDFCLSESEQEILKFLLRCLAKLPQNPQIIFTDQAVDFTDNVHMRPACFAFVKLVAQTRLRENKNQMPIPYIVAEARLPLEQGDARLRLYGGEAGFEQTKVIMIGDPKKFAQQSDQAVWIRLHSECFTGDVLGSRRCDCGAQLQDSLNIIAAKGMGILFYLPQEGRSIGLAAKLHAYNLQDQDALDTVDANLALGLAIDNRNFLFVIAILKQMGILKVKLITNNPAKVEALNASNIIVEEVILLSKHEHADNCAYLATKRARLHHYLK